MLGHTPRNGVWIGGVDFNHNRVWGWTDGSSFDYTNWLSSQPDGGEYYLVIEEADGRWTWRDFEYYHDQPYVCQLIL